LLQLSAKATLAGGGRGGGRLLQLSAKTATEGASRSEWGETQASSQGVLRTAYAATATERGFIRKANAANGKPKLPTKATAAEGGDLPLANAQQMGRQGGALASL